MRNPSESSPTVVPSRQGRRRSRRVDDQDRAAVLETALRLIDRDGAAALSVRRLAKEVGRSYQVVYTLFGGKQGLLDAIFRDGFARLGAVCRAQPVTASPRDDLAHLAATGRTFAHAHPELYALMFGRVGEFVPDVESRRVALRSFQVVHACAVRAFDALDPAERRFHDADALARAVWSATHGHVVLELDSWFGSEPDATARLEETVRALVGGANDDETPTRR